jgi:uncharacterized protein YvpB
MRHGLAALLVCLMVFVGSVRADELPESAYVSGVVGHPQRHMLSCESRSAVDWAAFFGVNISEDEFLYSLPASDNPDEGFVGYADDPWGYIPPYSYGVHADPVADLLAAYGLPADARRGLSWDELQAEIAAGRPAIVWVIGAMWPGSPREYTAANGDTVTVAYHEHTMILTGYNATTVTAVDASTGWSQAYSQGAFLASWGVLGNMAVITRPKPPTPTPTITPDLRAWLASAKFRLYFPIILNTRPTPNPTATPLPPTTYTVQAGDYLRKIADAHGTTWEELVRLNAIPYPYTIYPGQVLTLP